MRVVKDIGNYLFSLVNGPKIKALNKLKCWTPAWLGVFLH